MTVIGNPRSFHKKTCSCFEGGSLIPNKSPEWLTFSDVILERGATQDCDLFDWFQDVALTSSGLGLTDVNYKRNLDIVQQDRDGVTLRHWSLSRAWPIRAPRPRSIIGSSRGDDEDLRRRFRTAPRNPEGGKLRPGRDASRS